MGKIIAWGLDELLSVGIFLFGISSNIFYVLVFV
jgi:hypothetical protein